MRTEVDKGNKADTNPVTVRLRKSCYNFIWDVHLSLDVYKLKTLVHIHLVPLQLWEGFLFVFHYRR